MRYCSSFLISDVLARAPLAMDSSWMLEDTYRLEASGGDLLIPACSPARILLAPRHAMQRGLRHQRPASRHLRAKVPCLGQALLVLRMTSV